MKTYPPKLSPQGDVFLFSERYNLYIFFGGLLMQTQKNKSKAAVLTAFLFTLCALCAAFAFNTGTRNKPQTASAAGAPWDGSIATAFSGGDGTSAATAWEISSGAELAFLAQVINAGRGNTANDYYKLAADIYLNNTAGWESWDATAPANSWVPIGGMTNNFIANFDGSGFVVYGIYINTVSGSQGLFGNVMGGEISNLGVEQSYIIGGYYNGGIVGQLNDGSIMDCYNTGVVSGIEGIGGVTGVAWNGSVTNCFNVGRVAGSGADVGGIAGIVTSGSVINCYNLGTVSAANTGGRVGGITGSVGYSGITYYGKVVNCYNAGALWGSNRGGVAGSVYSGTSVTNSYFQSVSGSLGVANAVNINNGGTVTNAIAFDANGVFSNGQSISVGYKRYSAYLCALNAWVIFNQTSPEPSYLYYDGNGEFTETETLHNPKWITVSEPSCTEQGTKELRCAGCGAISDSGIIPALGHDFTDTYTVIKPSTCTANGVEGKKCSRCDEYIDGKYLGLDTDAHSFTDYIYDNNATYTADGTETAVCGHGCGERDTRAKEGSMLAHNYGPWTIAKYPTESQTGMLKSVCSLDKDHDHENTVVLPALNTTEYEYQVITPAGCGIDGAGRWTWIKLFYGTVAVDTVIPALVHNFSVAAAIPSALRTAATCNEAATYWYTCEVCGEPSDEYYFQSGAALGHDWMWTVTKPVTPTENGEETEICSRCGATRGTRTVPAHSHTYDEWIETTAPACTKAGENTRYCTHEGCAHSETQIIPAMGHNYGEWIIDVPATATTDGSRHRVCTGCGDIETQIIPATGGEQPKDKGKGCKKGAANFWGLLVSGVLIFAVKRKHS